MTVQQILLKEKPMLFRRTPSFLSQLIKLAIVASLGFAFNVSASINVTSLESGGINDWESESFEGESTYNVVQYDGRTVLKAQSNNSASGLVLKKKIDLLKTPYINWTWLTKNKLTGLDEKSKSGDDYVARVYVVIDGGFKVWNSKCLSYVWSSNQSEGQVWDNAFIGDKVKMLSVRGKQSKEDHWYNEKRNVFQDLVDQFGDKGSVKKNLAAYQYIDVIAIMTDTDNSAGKAESYYGDIIFTAE